MPQLPITMEQWKEEVSMNKCTERLFNGLIKENPTFVLMLGMCPTLAVTTSAINGLGMGLTHGCPCNVKHVDLHAAKDYPDSARVPSLL